MTEIPDTDGGGMTCGASEAVGAARPGNPPDRGRAVAFPIAAEFSAKGADQGSPGHRPGKRVPPFLEG